MSNSTEIAEEATVAAIESKKQTAEVVEFARMKQSEAQVESIKNETLNAVSNVLKDIFGESDTKDPEKMKVIMKRVPILCTNVQLMHETLEKIQDMLENKFVTKTDFNLVQKIVFGAVAIILVGFMGVLIKMAFQ